MAKLVEHHDKKQRQILEHVPGDGGILSRSAADFKGGHQKPGPMQEQINSGEAEQANRPLLTGGHVRRVISWHTPRLWSLQALGFWRSALGSDAGAGVKARQECPRHIHCGILTDQALAVVII